MGMLNLQCLYALFIYITLQVWPYGTGYECFVLLQKTDACLHHIPSREKLAGVLRHRFDLVQGRLYVASHSIREYIACAAIKHQKSDIISTSLEAPSFCP